MKKKVIYIIIFLILIFFIYLWIQASRLSMIRILSFERFYTGLSTVNQLSWTACDNVDHYEVILYDTDQNVVFKEETTDARVDIQDVLLTEGDRFFAEVVVKTKDHREYTTDTYSAIWKQANNKVAPVTSNRESGTVSGRKKVSLTTVTPDATIYYTTDGSDPLSQGKEYQEPISLDETMILQAVAKKEDYEDSEIASYSYEVKSTRPIVYLSPSTQEYNEGIKGSGFTTEEEMMNKIADEVEKILKKNDIIVYRNKPSMTAKTASQDSKKRDVDLHLAIHSNASPEDRKGRYSGVETWIYDDSCLEAKEIASRLQAAMMRIYYNSYGDRGVLNSVEIGGLRETNPDNVNNGILIEVAFHDNWNDAVWIVKNVKEIGRALAEAIVSYYQ